LSDLLFGHDETVAEWVAGQPFGQKFSPPYTTIGVISNGRLTGGFVFTSYDAAGPSVNISLAGRGVLAPAIWASVLDYVFVQMKCVRLGCHTSKANKMVRRCLPHLGFKFEGTARRKYGDNDGYSFSLTIDDLPAFRKRWRL
jgi:RimJ/RimL family protein N-acetyltransferase